MLVKGEGLLRPLAYGAQGKRSGLRASAVPYNSGMANLHFDGAKNQWRLLSFDARNTHDGFREDLDRFYTATTWAEILLKTHGAGGDSAALYELSASAFSLLSVSSREEGTRLNLGFLWNFLEIEGVQPDPGHCGRCGRVLTIGREDAPVRFMPNGILTGPECSEPRWPLLPDGARRWLVAISGKPLEDTLRIGLAEAAVKAADNWLLTIIQTLLERPLRSLRK
jgi:recombinational DNA repair protein (RecF pathway)